MLRKTVEAEGMPEGVHIVYFEKSIELYPKSKNRS